MDIVRRFLLQSGYKVHHVMNITDVDDKIIRNSVRDGVNWFQYTAKFGKSVFGRCGDDWNRAAETGARN